jgi:hypothetical protein
MWSTETDCQQMVMSQVLLQEYNMMLEEVCECRVQIKESQLKTDSG